MTFVFCLDKMLGYRMYAILDTPLSLLSFTPCPAAVNGSWFLKYVVPCPDPGLCMDCCCVWTTACLSFKFFLSFKFYFMFGCAVSSLHLHGLSLVVACRGYSFCGVWGERAQASVVGHAVSPRHVESSRTRGQTCAPCAGR